MKGLIEQQSSAASARACASATQQRVRQPGSNASKSIREATSLNAMHTFAIAAGTFVVGVFLGVVLMSLMAISRSED